MAVQPLFEEEPQALEHIDDDLGARQAAHDNIRSVVSLLYPAGHPVYRAGYPVPEFLPHIDGEDAWWRWADEPFTRAETES